MMTLPDSSDASASRSGVIVNAVLGEVDDAAIRQLRLVIAAPHQRGAL